VTAETNAAPATIEVQVAPAPSLRQRLVQLDLALGALLTIAALLATLAGAPVVLRLPLVLLLTLFLPGYGLLSALMTAPGLAALERTLISVATSIGVTVLCGLVMGLLNIPLDALNWVSALTLVSLTGYVLAWIARATRGVASPVITIPGMPFRHALMALLAVVLVADIALAGRLIASDQLGPQPVQLWIVAGANPQTAQLGMNGGPDGGTFELRVTNGGNVIAQYDLILQKGEDWQTTVSLATADPALPVVARLYQGDNEDELRYVVLQPGSSPPPAQSSPRGS
jgi:hypothetical protein